MITPTASSDTRDNSRLTRESSDQKLVENLKAQGYAALATALAKE